MASKRARRGGRPKRGSGPSKSDFVRQYPNLSAQEIVLKGKESGIAISPVLVYKVRGRPTPKRGAANETSGPKPEGTMNASDFVRSMPATMKAKEVIDAAKAKGISVSAGLVYAVRSASKRNGDSGKRMSSGRRRRPEAASTGDVASFKRLALNLGIARAKQTLDDLERRLAALLE